MTANLKHLTDHIYYHNTTTIKKKGGIFILLNVVDHSPPSQALGCVVVL